MQNMDILKKNQIHNVCIEGYTSEGLGVCHIGGQAVFVPRTVKGEVWDIKLVKVNSRTAYGIPVNLVLPAAERIVSACPYFGKCGGCDTQHMTYDEELRFKLEKVNDALSRIGKQTISAKEIIGSDKTVEYRNKGIFAIDNIDGKAAYGFYRERSHDLINIDSCLIQSQLSCRIAAELTSFMAANNIPAYDERTGKGVVRHVFCRHAVNRAGAVACIVAARGFGAKTSQLVDKLRNCFPELSGIVLNINKIRGNTVLAGDFYTLWGKDCITDTLCGFDFEISPQAFYQINPPQAEKLYNKAMEYAFSSPAKLAFDLYCGAGTISLCLARHAEKVIGAEIVPEAVINAEKNALSNNVSNAEFICADAGEAASMLAERGLKPDVVVVDPPRKGMDENAIKAVSSMKPHKIVYVSCNPSTLARDIMRFNKNNYILKEVTAVDMFPRTSHVETVALLIREDSSQKDLCQM